MKIIHCADIHADSKMGTYFTKEQAEIRRNEIVDSFEKMVKFARENGAKVIIIAGDLFDTKENQQKKIKQRIFYIIEQNPEIDFLYLRGNHDEDVDFFEEKSISNLKRFSKSRWQKYSYENIDIYGHEFSSSIPLAAYSELNPDPARINIVVLHGQIAEYKPKDDAPAISLPKLTNKNIDYIALGHIHDFKIEKLDNRCSWCYSGCLEGRGFDECGKKGFVLIDVQNNKVKADFVPISKRVVHEIPVKLSGVQNFSEIMRKITDLLAGISSKDIVQVDLTGELPEEMEIEPESYQSALASDYFYVRIKDKTETKIDYTKYEKDVSLKGEFIRLVKNQQNLSEEQKIKIIMTGIKALAGRLQ